MAVKAKKTSSKESSKEKAPKSLAASKSAAPKGGKAAAAAPVEGEPVADAEELEEQQAEAASSGGGGNAAALAAASGSTEMSASFKNFRHHPDMENFYRFIYENDLRHEALAIIDDVLTVKAQRRAVKGAKLQAH